jgi:hypothetical protein
MMMMLLRRCDDATTLLLLPQKMLILARKCDEAFEQQQSCAAAAHAGLVVQHGGLWVGLWFDGARVHAPSKSSLFIAYMHIVLLSASVFVLACALLQKTADGYDESIGGHQVAAWMG